MRSIHGWTGELGDRRACMPRRRARNGRRSAAADRSRRGDRAGSAGARTCPTRLHRQRGGGAGPPGVAGAVPPPRAPARRAAFRGCVPRAAGAGLVDAVRKLPQDLVLEGAGDCVWDRARNLFWMDMAHVRCRRAARGRGDVRTGGDRARARGPALYHMDTALCPLPRGEVLYVPEAFTAAGRGMIRHRVTAAQRIDVGRRTRAGWRPTPSASAMPLVMSGRGARCAAGWRARIPGGDDAARLRSCAAAAPRSA